MYMPDDETTPGDDAQKDATSEDVTSGHGLEERPDEGLEGDEGEGTGEGTAGPASGSSGPGSGG
jgi:hypothetical protein